MTTAKRIVCFGEVLMRLAPERHELLLQSPNLRATFAGAEANVAVALASFGQNAKLLTVLPDNALGRSALAELRGHGIDTRSIKFGDGRMGLFFLTPGAVRRPSEVLYDRTGSAFAMTPDVCDVAGELSGADWFHVSGVTPALGRACADATIAAVRKAQELRVPVSFDGNFRSKLWESWRSEAPGILKLVFESANLLFGDERDIALVLGKPLRVTDVEERRQRAAAQAFEAFPKLTHIASTIRTQLSVDRHAYGAVMYTRQGAIDVPPVELSGIVDRVGTGDAFAAGVIHGMLNGMPEATALKFGHAAACLKHSIPGDFLTLGSGAVLEAMESDRLDVKR